MPVRSSFHFVFRSRMRRMRPDTLNLWTLLFWPCVALAILLVALVIAFVQTRSLLRENADPTESAHELLSQYREMRGRGELSDEEFRFIKGRLAPRISNGVSPPTVEKPMQNAIGEFESDDDGSSDAVEADDRM